MFHERIIVKNLLMLCPIQGVRIRFDWLSDKVHTYNVYQHAEPAFLTKIDWWKEPNVSEEFYKKPILALSLTEKQTLIDRVQD
jgi:hypothetical protein